MHWPPLSSIFTESIYPTPTLKNTINLLTLLCLLLALFTCGRALPDEVEAEYASLPEQIDFNFHVKPILSDRCYACHGPDMKNQQADLRLDTPEGAYAALASGHGVAIKPGSLSESEMIRRITSDDPELVMPTPESNLTLEPREIAILAKWIEQGAEYKEHWAFTKPVQPEVPTAGEGWAKNPVDRFIAAKLELEQVEPSPEAERPYLIRRVFFDLSGLPPTTDEITKWESATDDDWYEQLVDELMARPAYGERMANYWMDVARFADSEGYLDDFAHAMWPYRDWVIKSYNENLPHNKFIEWQVGGDQFENPTTEMRLATAFNRNHKQNSEGGIIPEEFRVEYNVDRTSTVGTAFMGLTIACARCHDHKYAPISQENFYELYSFFNNTVERGDGIFSYNGLENGQMVENRLAMNSGPTLPLPDSVTEAVYTHIQHLIDEKETTLAEMTDEVETPTAAPALAQVERTVSRHTVNHLTFDEQPVRDHARGVDIIWQNSKTGPGRLGKGVIVSPGSLVTQGEKSAFERNEPFTVSFWINAPKLYDEAYFLNNSNNRIQGYRGWDAMLDSNRVHFRLSHAHPYQSIDLRVDEPLEVGTWNHFVWSYDGSGEAAGMRVYRNGEQIRPSVVRDYLVPGERW